MRCAWSSPSSLGFRIHTSYLKLRSQLFVLSWFLPTHTTDLVFVICRIPTRPPALATLTYIPSKPKISWRDTVGLDGRHSKSGGVSTSSRNNESPSSKWRMSLVGNGHKGKTDQCTNKRNEHTQVMYRHDIHQHQKPSWTLVLGNVIKPNQGVKGYVYMSEPRQRHFGALQIVSRPIAVSPSR